MKVVGYVRVSTEDQPINLSGQSAEALEALAKRALALASDLRQQEPSYRLALVAGVQDKGYQTIRQGWVNSYSGEAIVTLANGSRWKAVGRGTKGSPEYVWREGFIEFFPLPVEQVALPAGGGK